MYIERPFFTDWFPHCSYVFAFKCLLTFILTNKTNSSIYCNIIPAPTKPGTFIHFKPSAVGLSPLDLNGGQTPVSAH